MNKPKTLDGQLIENLPVCADGKAKIKALVEAMGYAFEDKSRKPKVGEVWRIPTWGFVLISNYIIDEEVELAYTYLDGGAIGVTHTFKDSDWKAYHYSFAYPSLEAYFNAERGR